ncbi:MAG TPA: methionyl-tRNA formyltransferase [Stellaceae bacterium]|nr:methionyl-tRNA formyltransferase [Stellaceae bacterium]
MPPLDLVFMGTPEFAATILAALIDAGHRVAAVYTQPPRPAGRGHRPQPSPVAMLAERHGITVRCPVTLRSPEAQAEFAAIPAEAAVVAAYGLILPAPVLAAPRHGCLNVHASLLPRWRGAAPIQRALLAGDSETGITIMQMDEGLDTGPILLQQAMPIGPHTTSGELSERLAALGARLILDALDRLARGTLAGRPQPEAGVTYAAKLHRTEARLDWRLPASDLERQVRAFDPWPGAWFERRGERIRVLAAEAEARVAGAPPGTVLDTQLSVACGTGVLRPLRLQRQGRGALDAAAFLRGFALPPGTVLPCPVTG